MKIRAVTHDDIDAIVDLWTRVFPEYGDPLKPQRDPRRNIERKLAFGDGLFWLGVQDSALAGQTLVAHAEAQLGALGCPKINLQVLDDNSGALAFWRSVGYAPDAVLSLGKRL